MSEVEPAPLWGGTSYPFSITFHPGLARALEHAGYGSATTKAIILSRIHDLLPTSPFIRDGVPWVGNSHTHWRADHFPFLSVEGIKGLLTDLEKDGLLLAYRTGRTNPVKYRPNYPKIAELQTNEPEKLVANEQIKVVIGKQEPYTNATTEQDAPQTIPRPGEPTQDVTAARVEQAAPRSHDPSTYVIKRLDGTNMEWESGRDVFVCSVQAYMDALEQRWRAKGAHEQDRPHPRNYPNIITEKDGRRITLHVTKEAFRSSEGLQNAVAAHFGWKKRGKRWERR